MVKLFYNITDMSTGFLIYLCTLNVLVKHEKKTLLSNKNSCMGWDS